MTRTDLGPPPDWLRPKPSGKASGAKLRKVRRQFGALLEADRDFVAERVRAGLARFCEMYATWRKEKDQYHRVLEDKARRVLAKGRLNEAVYGVVRPWTGLNIAGKCPAGLARLRLEVSRDKEPPTPAERRHAKAALEALDWNRRLSERQKTERVLAARRTAFRRRYPRGRYVDHTWRIRLIPPDREGLKHSPSRLTWNELTELDPHDLLHIAYARLGQLWDPQTLDPIMPFKRTIPQIGDVDAGNWFAVYAIRPEGRSTRADEPPDVDTDVLPPRLAARFLELIDHDVRRHRSGKRTPQNKDFDDSLLPPASRKLWRWLEGRNASGPELIKERLAANDNALRQRFTEIRNIFGSRKAVVWTRERGYYRPDRPPETFAPVAKRRPGVRAK